MEAKSCLNGTKITCLGVFVGVSVTKASGMNGMVGEEVGSSLETVGGSFWLSVG